MKVLLTLAIATVAGALTFGAAASLNLNAPNLGSGTQRIDNCEGEGGISVDYDLNDSNPSLVTGIRISNIAPSCSGGTAYLALLGEDGTGVIGSFSEQISADATAVDVSVSDIPAEQIHGIEVTIVGPTNTVDLAP